MTSDELYALKAGDRLRMSHPTGLIILGVVTSFKSGVVSIRWDGQGGKWKLSARSADGRMKMSWVQRVEPAV